MARGKRQEARTESGQFPNVKVWWESLEPGTISHWSDISPVKINSSSSVVLVVVE